MNNYTQKATIKNQLGLHARPAAMIAKIAQKAVKTIWIQKDTQKVDASSVIDILTLECPQGTEISLHIDDPSDNNLVLEIVTLIESGLEE